MEVAQWIMNPFVNIMKADAQIQEELVELSINEILKVMVITSQNFGFKVTPVTSIMDLHKGGVEIIFAS